MTAASRVEGSFRDPSGHVFRRNGTLYRQINRRSRDDFHALTTSGLYDELTAEALLIPHRDADLALADTDDACAVIEPEPLEFVSYPYEWCFGQLKDAALLTLDIERRALERGMTLRDATAYNVQFRGAQAVFIDTLSLGKQPEGEPWVAYRQFCEHFLAPLALMALRDIRCGELLRHYLNGIPLDLASEMVPRRTYARFGLLLHLHMHSRAQRRYEGNRAADAVRRSGGSMSRDALLKLIDNLRATIEHLTWDPSGTEWADYVSDNNYSGAATDSKARTVREMLSSVRPSTVWDLGANTGQFSRVAAEVAPSVVSFDLDPAAVERNYRMARRERTDRILPLVLDLTNPSAAQGWAHSERQSLEQRGPADAVLALALIHHLAISNNVPLAGIADYFARLCRSLVIEFVPKTDSQVKRLLASREDVFPSYTEKGFVAAFERRFDIRAVADVAESDRRLFLMTRRRSDGP
jgi:hypothetical protein